MSTLIQLNDIHKQYGPHVIFESVSEAFTSRDRVGLIGRNGAGKTTLCRLILGEEEPDHGKVVLTSACRLGYLEQRDPYEPDESVIGFLMRYTDREDWQCGKLAGRFQLRGEVLEQPIGKLPGGFQTRVKLTAMLLRDPNFLILDEPTNYLDLKTLILLERFLKGFRGGFIIVSHDREFLARTCDQTAEAERGTVTRYRGPIEGYFEYKAEQRRLAESHNRNVEVRRKQLQRFVDKNRVRASTASQAQSKMKQLERLETLEVDSDLPTANIRIPPTESRKGVALRLEDLEIGYPGVSVADDIRFEIERGEHVAVLGDNGQGKTTFLRTITGELEPRDGRFRWGHGIEPGYYAQHVYSALDTDLDVVTYLEQKARSGITRQGVLDMAGSFLFRGNDVEKSVSVLSGGERARLCLAGLLLQGSPVLLLDEPTNHLDFETVEALGEALKSYDGTILFISHDRTFVKLVATSVVEVKDGSVHLYPGDYDGYLSRLEQEIDLEDSPGEEGAGAPAAPRSPTNPAERKKRRARISKLKKEITASESRTESLQGEKEKLLAHFLENPSDPDPAPRIRLSAIDPELEAEETRWVELQEELETLESED